MSHGLLLLRNLCTENAVSEQFLCTEVKDDSSQVEEKSLKSSKFPYQSDEGSSESNEAAAVTTSWSVSASQPLMSIDLSRRDRGQELERNTPLTTTNKVSCHF